ncbi:MAG: heavy metal-binding domain-containing protein, partial [bacterium]
MAKDPICGMTVDKATSLRAERDGQTFYFCSEHCRQKFLAQPATVVPTPQPVAIHASHHHAEEQHAASGHAGHLSKAQSNGEHSRAPEVKPSPSAKYFCPMCPGVESDEPGDCPKCGMALELNPAWKPKSKVIYTCPMHPEIEQDHPGECPICGMALEPKTIAAETEEENAERRDMTRRFWIGAALTLPVFLLAMAHLIPALNVVPENISRWIQFILSTPVVCWA